MKYILFVLFSLLCSSNSNGQIKTPSFAKYNRCPNGYGQIARCPGWRQPTGGSCDYFNSCCSTIYVSVPNNFLGYQDNAIHAYAGLLTLSDFSWQEYIGTTIPALTVGNTYTMSITVSLADSSSIATDGMGALFTTYPYTQVSSGVIPLTPQINYSSYGPIKDMVNWVTLTGSFVADSAYTHLIVGSFKDIPTMIKDTVGQPTAYGWYSYYYIREIGMMDSTYFGDSTYAPYVDTTTYPPIDTTRQSGEEEPDTVAYVFPNAFTPNGDGKNDVFRIKGKKGNDYAGYTLRVYNRWGECVYMGRDPNDGWDGRHNGKPQDVGVYFYLAQFGLKNEHVLAKAM